MTSDAAAVRPHFSQGDGTDMTETTRKKAATSRAPFNAAQCRSPSVRSTVVDSCQPIMKSSRLRAPQKPSKNANENVIEEKTLINSTENMFLGRSQSLRSSHHHRGGSYYRFHYFYTFSLLPLSWKSIDRCEKCLRFVAVFARRLIAERSAFAGH